MVSVCVCVCVCVCMCVCEVGDAECVCQRRRGECMHAQSCLTLCNPMDCSLSSSSVHGNFPGGRELLIFGCYYHANPYDRLAFV